MKLGYLKGAELEFIKFVCKGERVGAGHLPHMLGCAVRQVNEEGKLAG